MKNTLHKRLKTSALFLLGILLLLTLLSGCDGNNNAPAPTQEPETSAAADTGVQEESDKSTPAYTAEELGAAVDLKLGHLFPVTDYRAQAMQKFVDLCDQYSGGNIKITVFPNSTLVTSQDALKLTKSGATDLGMGSLSFNVSEVPALAPFDVQGIYDPDYFWETYEIVKPVLDKILETQNQKGLMIFDETDSLFYVNKKNQREVHTPNDIKGLRLRDHGMWIGKSISAWGAAPQTVMPADIAVALEKGTVDGGYTGWGFVHSYRAFENAPYISYAKIAKSCWSPLGINLDVWNSLTPAQQEIMLRAGAEATEYQKPLVEAQFEEFKKAVEEAGGSIYYLTKEENQAFVDAAAPLIEECRQTSGELGAELIDALLSAPSNYR